MRIDIGAIYWSRTPYYNRQTGRNGFKRRPILIIGKADNTDYAALPVSRVTNQNNRDPKYDVPVDPTSYPSLQLTNVSFIRTHKQFYINGNDILTYMGSLKQDYPDTFLNVMILVEEYQKHIIHNSLQ